MATSGPVHDMAAVLSAEAEAGNNSETYQNLFVTKLHRNIKDQDLLTLFAPFGGKSATVMLDAKTGRSKGFGFVLFDTEVEGKRAHEAMHQRQINIAGCAAQLSIFPSKHDAKNAVDPSPSLYVRNVPISSSKEEVERVLEQFGSVAFCAMREEPDGLPVWVVLVEYDCQQCADNALSHLRHNTTLYPGAPLPVIAKYAKAMDRKRSLTSRKRQNAAKNCPFKSARFVAGGSGSGAGPLAGNSYGGEASYGNSVGSESLGSLWAAQMSASQHGGNSGPIPHYVTTTTNPNGSTTTTAYFADPGLPMQNLNIYNGIPQHHLSHLSPQLGVVGDPMHLPFGGGPQLQGQMSHSVPMQPAESTMFVNNQMPMGAPQPFLQLPQQLGPNQYQQRSAPPNYAPVNNGIPNAHQFVTFAPPPQQPHQGGTHFYNIPARQNGY